MATIDLGSPPAAPVGLFDGLPRRVALTLPELRYAARHVGDAPLPFDLQEPTPDPAAGRDGRLSGRLGAGVGLVGPAAEDAAFLEAVAAMHDPATSLSRRGLLLTEPGADRSPVVDAGLAGAIGLLAAPSTAVDIEIVAGGVHGRSWHRSDDGAVATLSTVDGMVFELAWFPTSAWTAELARVAVLPEDLRLRASVVPAEIELPYELADAAAEAVRSNRADLLPVLVAQHAGRIHDGAGRALPEHEVIAALAALSTEARGRLRALTADVSGDVTTVVGVVSWTLLSDGWRALRAAQVDDELRVHVTRVESGDLATQLAPVIAEVRR